MSVLMSNNGNKYVLSSATNALVELFTTYPNLRHLCASKGIIKVLIAFVCDIVQIFYDQNIINYLCIEKSFSSFYLFVLACSFDVGLFVVSSW